MIRQKRLTRDNSSQLLKPGTAHFNRPARSSRRASLGNDNDVIMPGSPRRVRHKHHKPSENGTEELPSANSINKTITNSNKTTQVEQLQERGCSRGFRHGKYKDEALVKSRPVPPPREIVAKQKVRRRSVGYGYNPAKVDTLVLDVPDPDSDRDSSDSDDSIPVAAPTDHGCRSRSRSRRGVDESRDDKEEAARQTRNLQRTYRKSCDLAEVTPCGRYMRQISQPVVDVSASQLGTNDIKGICVSLAYNIHITDLDISGNDLGGKGAGYLAEAIRENTSINELAVAQCNLNLEGLKGLAAVFLDMKPMKRLDMSSNKFSMKHAEVISEVIQKNDYIEDLSLSGNEFDEQGGILLGKALINNVGIKKLDLSWNHLRRDGAKAVCLALKHNTTIEELDLSWNGLAEEGCRALGEALPHNHTLRDLDISCNRINIFSLNHFLKGLAHNDTLQVLRIDQNPLTTDGAIGIMKTLTNSPCSQMTDIHMIDIPINEDFLESLDELLKVHQVKVYHRDPNRKRITPLVRERTLGDYDPAMILFEYMKQEHLRLIDLFRTFDTDGNQSVSKEELKEGFMTINMPLSDDALESLFDKLDLNENEQIDYDEYKVGYRKAMKKLRCRSNAPQDGEAIDQLKSLVHRALVDKRTDEALARGYRKRRQRQASLVAVFAVADNDSILEKLPPEMVSKLHE